jgi:hypothetical protein
MYGQPAKTYVLWYLPSGLNLGDLVQNLADRFRVFACGLFALDNGSTPSVAAHKERDKTWIRNLYCLVSLAVQDAVGNAPTVVSPDKVILTPE